MASTIQTGPYEILLRFNCERGEVFGQLRGCSRVMASYLVDDAGNIAGRIDTGELAADFPASDLMKYLGDQFATFTSQLEKVNSDLQAARNDNTELQARLTAAQQQLAESLAVAQPTPEQAPT